MKTNSTPTVLANLLGKSLENIETNNLQSSSPTLSRNSGNQPPPTTAIVRSEAEARKFLVSFAPDRQAEYVARHEARCYIGDAPSLIRATRLYGDAVVFTWLASQLRELEEFSGCRDKLTPEQMQSLCDTIRANYRHLKVTEIMAFLQRFKAGEYGKFYGAVDALAITEALHRFDRQRQEIAQIFQAEEDRRQREQRYAERKRNAISHAEYLRLRQQETENNSQTLNNPYQ